MSLFERTSRLRLKNETQQLSLDTLGAVMINCGLNMFTLIGFSISEHRRWGSFVTHNLQKIISKISTIVIILFLLISQSTMSAEFPTSKRAEKAIDKVEPSLKTALKLRGLEFGAPIFIRIFKQPGVLEVWVESKDGKYKKFKDYQICTFSGNLGPKIKQGDNQSPEGFYFVNASRLNPWSQFHLSFNLGYPNQYDRYHGRTGSALMVHGNCVSIGCYAMTDNYINEIYAIADAALRNGQSYFRVHSFPFKFDTNKLEEHKENKWYSFWQNLKTGYDYFEINQRPPNVNVKNGIYTFNDERD